MTPRPDLIIPIRDRRQHRRILTLKNAAKAGVAVIIFLAGLMVNGNFRKIPAGEYGRLFGTQVPAPTATLPAKPVPVVEEAPASVATAAADPMLEAPVATESSADLQETTATVQPQPVPATTAAIVRDDGKGVAIIGGTEGVTIVRGGSDSARPVLRGGIFRESQ